MSHIDNALEKAQKERDSTYKRYNHIIPVEPHKHTNRKARWVAVAAAVIVGFSATLVLLSFHGTTPLEKKNPAIQRKDAGAQERVTIAHKTSSEAPAMPGDTNIGQQGSDVTHRADPSDTGAYRESNTHTGAGSNATEKTAQEQTPAEGIDTLYKRALGYQKKGEVERAEEEYKNILRIEPGHVFSLNNLGVIYMVRGRSQDAAQMFERSIKTKGDYVNPYYNLACLYSQKEDIPRALDYLERAMLINNDVKNWAKNDRDLDRLRQSAGYARVMGEGAASSEISSPVYVVCEGDRIFDVIRREFESSGKEAYTILELIKQLNPMMEDSNMVYPGWRLKLPGKEAVERAISSHATPQKENEPLSNIQPHD
ncbi:MAG: tetratricopeptide repeat protein [Syntrophobacterales bacterium]|nr:MAG: tetratricopeptide repeat protein [Syntrophobacterales bacterium]